jgi:hypothetical protein
MLLALQQNNLLGEAAPVPALEEIVPYLLA